MLNKHKNGFFSTIFAAGCIFSVLSFTNVSAMQQHLSAALLQRKSAPLISSSVETKETAIHDLSNKLNLPYDVVSEILHVTDKCKLVPLMPSEEHKNCLIDIFSYSDKEYMKYYLDGKLRTPKDVEEKFWKVSLFKLWGKPTPSSVTFIIDYDNNSVGRIGVGPIKNDGKVDCEIGYAIKQQYAGKKLTSSSVKAVLDLLQYMVSSRPDDYNFSRLRATAAIDNGPSNHILTKLGFKKSAELVNDGYGYKNEYFYFFK